MTTMTLLIVTLVGCSVVMVSASGRHCLIPEAERKNCGPDLDEWNCEYHGCCWQPCPTCAAAVPSCFYAEGQVRLSDDFGDDTDYFDYERPYIGPISIYHDGRWGAVCKHGFDTLDAQVACRSVGYFGNYVLERRGIWKGPIWMSELQCDGSEATLADCKFSGWGNNNCTHDETLGVHCDEIDYALMYEYDAQ